MTFCILELGQFVKRDEQIATIETDKIDVQVNSPESGTVTELFASEGDTVSVGGNLFKLTLSDAPTADQIASDKKEAPAPPPAAAPPVQQVKKEAPPPPKVSSPPPIETKKSDPTPPVKPTSSPTGTSLFGGVRTEKRVYFII